MTMMLAPYTSALRMPRARVPERLVKKLTVMGSSGKMQGIITAAKPPSRPAKNVTHKEDWAGAGAAGWLAGVAGAAGLAVAEVAARLAAAGAVAVSVALAAGAASSTGVN
ncbi:hypothetical protein GCM10023172_35020 [Hymenobacter ginsengisoli]|uniref:Uncharacterized protein n=1 Tax=Hymenobacter ginsengisoli TaxID=1051626 RepID=A0ABP8QM03_9BACT